MLALLILCAGSVVFARRKAWSSGDPEVDDGRINVYKQTLRQYQGKTMDGREEIKSVLKEIHTMDWDKYYYNKHFNDPSESSDS